MRRALLIAVCVLAGIVVPALSAAAQVTTATTSVVTNIEARNFGQLTGAANARAIQLNMRLSF